VVDTPPEEVERDADQIERVPLGFRSRGVVRASAIGMSSLPNTSARACCSFSYVRSLPQMTTVTFSGFTRRRGARAGAAVLRFGELFVSLSSDMLIRVPSRLVGSYPAGRLCLKVTPSCSAFPASSLSVARTP